MSKDEFIKGEGKQECILLSFLPSEPNIVKQDPQVFNGQSVLISNFIKKKKQLTTCINYVCFKHNMEKLKVFKMKKKL